jgi:hypothetical protein
MYNNPFGEHYTLGESSWSDLYRHVCAIDYLKENPVMDGKRNNKMSTAGRLGSNQDVSNNIDASLVNIGSGWIDKRSCTRHGTIDMIYKLQIALLMRGDGLDWSYKYRPQHVIHEELCMVLQKRAFVLLPENRSGTEDKNGNRSQSNRNRMSIIESDQMNVVEIPLGEYRKSNRNHILVREIAFGPDGDSSVKGVAIFFNIQDDDVIVCTQTQAKRFRWKRGLKNDKIQEEKARLSVLQTLDHFPMIRPDDPVSYQLASDMLRHRLSVLQKERICNMRARYDALQELDHEKAVLQERYETLRRNWISWGWPVNVGRDKVDKKTPVPKVDSKYVIAASVNNSTDSAAHKKGSTYDDDDDLSLSSGKRLPHLGSAISSIWQSFVCTDMQQDTEEVRWGDEMNRRYNFF